MTRTGPSPRVDEKELIPALFFLAVGLFFLFNAVFVIGLDEVASGAATFAAIVSVLLIGIAVSLLFRSVLPSGERLTFVALPKLLAVLGAPIVFGITVRPMGLLPALVLSLICSSFADSTTPLARRILPLLAITALCVVIFHYGLRLPFPLVTGLNLY